MSTFADRLLQAARHAGIRDTQSAIATALGLKRQTVNYWFHGGEPTAENLLDIAGRWDVDPDWLQSGKGEMLPKPATENLSQDEMNLVKDYRMASPKVRQVISTMARAARKAVVAVTLAIPPLLAPQQSEAGGVLHKSFCTAGLNTHWRRLLRWLGAAAQQPRIVNVT